MSAAMQSRIGVVVVGYGYWGPNIVRNVVECPEFRLMGLCERDERRVAEFHTRYPATWVDADLEVALADPRVDAVAIATPPSTHHALVSRALEAGKHVLVEKPLATTAADAVELIKLAEDRGLVLMPGHTFVYSPAVQRVRELIQQDELGEVYFITSSRMNLGKYQSDGVVCDLAPHDLSILAHWLDEPLTQVSATGRSVFQEGVPETAFLTLTFASGAKANIQVSWLAPRKVRQMVVVGSKRMIHYEDTAADESVRIYDRGLDFDEPPSNFGEYRLTYRTGDMVAPRIEATEPLGLEFQDFARAIREGAEPRSSSKLGLQIVLALEALEESLQRRGEPVDVRTVAEALQTSDVRRQTSGNGNGNGHVANGNGHVANGNGHVANGNGHVANGNGHHSNGNGHGTNGNGHASGNGHRANGNGNGHVVTRPDGRARERRMGERRLEERRVVQLGAPHGNERRVNDRRTAERRLRDRRAVAASIGAPAPEAD